MRESRWSRGHRRAFLGRGFGDQGLGPDHLDHRCAERPSIGDQVQGPSVTDRATRQPRRDAVWGDIFRIPVSNMTTGRRGMYETQS